MITHLSRRFHLVRKEDASGISGVGIVAQGVEWSNGFVSMSWLTPISSVCVYTSIHSVEAIHGHDGRTEIVWDDPPVT